MRYFLGSIIVLFAFAGASAQHQDTIKLFTDGDITSRTFQVEEIQVHSDCECVGACTCDSWQNLHPEDRIESADKILARSASISLIRRGNYGFEPILNGLTTERTNLTIDGMKIFGACTGKMDPVTSYVEPNNLKQFEVENGAAGSEYGTSLGGSIDMQTEGAKIGAANSWSGNAGLGYDAVSNGMNGMLSLNRSAEKWAINMNGTYRKSADYRAGGGEIIDFSQFEKWNTSLSAKYMISQRDLLRFDFIYDDASNVGYPGLPMDVDHAIGQIYGLTYIHYPAGDLFTKLTFKAYGNNIDHMMDNAQRPERTMLMDMPGWANTYGAFAKAEMTAGKHDIVAKLDGYYNNSFSDMTMFPDDADIMYMVTWPDVDKNDIGLYLSDNYNLTKTDIISVKGRIEYVSSLATSQIGIDQAAIIGQDISNLEERITSSLSAGYQKKLSDKFTSWVNFGYTERAPNVTEQYAFYIYNAYDGYNYIGDIDLQNEKAAQAEIGFNYQSGNNYGIRATAFYYQMFDYILSKVDPDLPAVTGGANGVKITDNIAKATNTGGTITLFYNPATKVNLNSQFSFTRGETGEGTPLPLMSPVRNTTSVKYLFSNKGHLALEAVSALAQDRISPDFGEITSVGYTIFNIRAGYDFKFAKNTLTVNAGVENFLDKNYRDHLDWGTIPRPGRNLYIDLRFQF